jgi:hypothetical protein
MINQRFEQNRNDEESLRIQNNFKQKVSDNVSSNSDLSGEQAAFDSNNLADMKSNI